MGWPLFLGVAALVHLYAVYLAYVTRNLEAAVLTLFLPVLSDLFWLYIVVTGAGLAHPYVLLCVLLVALLAAGGAAFAVHKRSEQREMETVLADGEFHQQFSPNTSRTPRKDPRADEDRAVIPCVQCGTKLRLPRGRTGTVRCPRCNNPGFYST